MSMLALSLRKKTMTEKEIYSKLETIIRDYLPEDVSKRKYQTRK
jgi:hypothetical protein